MALFDVHIELQTVCGILERIAVSLERIAGPCPVPDVQPTQSSLADYYRLTPAAYRDKADMQQELAKRMNVVPGSQAYIDLIARIEADVKETLGDEAAAALPWRNA
jgi:hypothetical protein